MQLAYRHERPGESYEALDGKKGSIRHNILSINLIGGFGDSKVLICFMESLEYVLMLLILPIVLGSFASRYVGSSTREAPTPSPKIISMSGTKNESKTGPLYLLVLVMIIFLFLFC